MGKKKIFLVFLWGCVCGLVGWCPRGGVFVKVGGGFGGFVVGWGWWGVVGDWGREGG